MIYNSTLYKTNGIYNGEGIYKGVDALPPVAAMTLRFKFSDLTYSPVVAGVGSSGTWQQVKADPNIWDWTRTSTNWSSSFRDAFKGVNNMVDIIDAGDTSSVINLASCFHGCTSLKSVKPFNTSSVITMGWAFYSCSALKFVPLFNTSDLTDINNAFRDCIAVAGGALALYTQASTQSTPPSSYSNCFRNCGTSTTTGAAELAQIPASWGGTAP